MMNTIVKKYYDAFNSQDFEGMLSCLTEDVIHDVNEGNPEIGIPKFRSFLKVMDECYTETVEDLTVMSDENGSRMSAEFFIRGVYKKSQAGLPEARNQKYHIRVGAFFDIENGKIKRVTNYYNLKDWIQQVSK